MCTLFAKFTFDEHIVTVGAATPHCIAVRGFFIALT